MGLIDEKHVSNTQKAFPRDSWKNIGKQTQKHEKFPKKKKKQRREP